MNLMQLVTGFATPVITSKIAGALGVPEGAVRKVVSVAVPVLLGAVMKRASSPGGTDALASALRGMGKQPMGSLGQALGGDPARVAKAGSTGTDMLSSLLGGGTAGTLASSLASYAGIDEKAAAPLLGLAGSMTLGGLRKTMDEQGVDAAGIVGMLKSQKDEIAKAVPADFAARLEGTDILGSDLLKAAKATAAPAAAAATTATTARTAPASAARTAPSTAAETARRGGMTRWIIGLIVLLLLIWLVSGWFGGPDEEVVEEEVVEEPAADAPAEPEEEPAN